MPNTNSRRGKAAEEEVEGEDAVTSWLGDENSALADLLLDRRLVRSSSPSVLLVMRLLLLLLLLLFTWSSIHGDARKKGFALRVFLLVKKRKQNKKN